MMTETKYIYLLFSLTLKYLEIKFLISLRDIIIKTKVFKID